MRPFSASAPMRSPSSPAGVTDLLLQARRRRRRLGAVRAGHRRDLAAHQGRLLHHDHAGLRADGLFLLRLAVGLWRRRRHHARRPARRCSARAVLGERPGAVLLRRARRCSSASSCWPAPSSASRFGRVLRGIRENPVRMQAIGFPPFPYQLTAYRHRRRHGRRRRRALANQAEFVSPAFMTWQRSGELIVMVVLGGIGTLVGAIVGAVGLPAAGGMARRRHRALEAAASASLLVLVVLFAAAASPAADRPLAGARR